MRSRAQEREILETLRAIRNDPEVGRGVIDHGRHHAAEAEVGRSDEERGVRVQRAPHLHHHQEHRKHDADERSDKAKPILEKISRCERKNE